MKDCISCVDDNIEEGNDQLSTYVIHKLAGALHLKQDKFMMSMCNEGLWPRSNNTIFLLTVNRLSEDVEREIINCFLLMLFYIQKPSALHLKHVNYPLTCQLKDLFGLAVSRRAVWKNWNFKTQLMKTQFLKAQCSVWIAVLVVCLSTVGVQGQWLQVGSFRRWWTFAILLVYHVRGLKGN